MSDKNLALYDAIIQHQADVRLYEVETTTNSERAIRRHKKRLTDLIRKDPRAELQPEVQRAMTELHAVAKNSNEDLKKASEQFHTNNLQKQAGGFFSIQRPVRGSDVAEEMLGPNVFLPRSLREEFNNIGSSELIRLRGVINNGLANGHSQKKILEDAMRAVDSTSSKVRALIRTTISNTEAEAVDHVMRANSDLLYGYRFTAVLDSRTSRICSYHDGKVYKLGDNKYRPPLHWNCRSTMVPVLKSKKQLEEENSARLKKAGLEKIKDVDLSGKAPPVEGYSGWLRRQPMAVKVDHLGSEEQVSLFERGMLEVKDFFTAIGKSVSIARLRKLDNARTFTDKTGKLRVNDADFTVPVARPYDLMRSRDAQEALMEMYINDAASTKQALSLTDYRGTSLIGKRTTRARTYNELDERMNQFDPFTGEMKTNLYYDPDFSVYQERLDYLDSSKVLTKDQKQFIKDLAESLEDKIGVNQQSAVVENLRVLFERYANNKEQWGDFASLARKESQFSVVNVSRILQQLRVG
jgi:SPP1 gp7 family putative phage head morphogenesis protein